MQNRFYRFLAEVEIVNYYYKYVITINITINIITVDVLQLKLIVSIPQHIKFFNNYLSSPRANFSQQMYAVSLAQYQSLPFNSLYSSSRPLLGFKDDYIAEVTFLLIRFFNTFLKMQRMVTETVFISKKSTMKYRTYNLNHET